MNICIFGDSITWGAYDPDGGGWATRIRNYFEAQNQDVDVYNLGISGDSTADLINRIEREAKPREPDLIVFAIGINDAQFIHSTGNPRISAAKFQDNLEKILSIAKKFTSNLVVITTAFAGGLMIANMAARPGRSGTWKIPVKISPRPRSFYW